MWPEKLSAQALCGFDTGSLGNLKHSQWAIPDARERVPGRGGKKRNEDDFAIIGVCPKLS